ncbi:MAG: hypothetical protein DRP71_05925 [Verrucomicrobia bacterium]|nr:MAG: hypothetical protein DRP71_05925 [Verrucomicrobiota bacterium]
MKKTLTALALAAALGSGSASYAAFTLSTDLTFGSEYVFRGIKLADNTLHPSVEAGFDNFYIGIWGALPTEKRSSMGYIDEWDAYAGYMFSLSDNLSLDIGATYYYYPIDQDFGTFEPYVGLSWDLDGWSPGLYAYYDTDLETWTGQGSVGYSIPLASVGTSLDLTGTFGYVKPNEGDDYMYYGVSAVVPYQISKNASVSAGVHWASHDIEGLDDNHVYFTVSVTMSM